MKGQLGHMQQRITNSSGERVKAGLFELMKQTTSSVYLSTGENERRHTEYEAPEQQLCSLEDSM